MSVAAKSPMNASFRSPSLMAAPDFSRRALCIQGLLCDAVTLDQAKQIVVSSIRGGRRCNLVTPNADFLRLMRQDADFRDAVLANDLSLIDGAPLVWLARMLGFTVPGRVCGSDLCAALMADRDERIGAFFFGATEDIGLRVRNRLENNRSGLQCAGLCSPGFGSVDSMSDRGIIDAINRANPDLLIVSIGARKGLLWLNRNEHLLRAPIVGNLGATINFIAGSVKRAPAFFRRHGLEWLWRIKEEPALWTRYALDLVVLVSVLVGQILPLLVQHALHGPSPGELKDARLRHRPHETAEVIELSGAWTKDNLVPLSAVLTAVTQTASDLIIDLNGVTFVDAAFMGQILLAYGHQRRAHRGFALRASNRHIARMLRLHGCAYLLMAGEGSADVGSFHPATGHGIRKLRESAIASRARS
jgi:N-acetylglucosaminyldiphosphoundecaprenol N-acetyl-beta-D-mannosaminyltransferase